MERSASGNNLIRTCLVIPAYNHTQALASFLNDLRPYGLPCILIDDASDDSGAIDRLACRDASWIRLIRHDQNQGKGAAVVTGAREALNSGYTHILQIDADGQHAHQDIPRFLAAAEAQPEAVICGVPIFDESAPVSRRWGRLMTNFWIWINTLSFEIKDGLCGFRVYPLAPLLELARQARLGKGMEFDLEVLVRLKWRGLSIICVPTPIRYPIDGRSNFKLGRDNWRISSMHARLFFGMLNNQLLTVIGKWAGTQRKS